MYMYIEYLSLICKGQRGAGAGEAARNLGATRCKRSEPLDNLMRMDQYDDEASVFFRRTRGRKRVI